MQNKKLKHKKIKNTGLLYEFLIRQTTSDVLKGNEPQSLNLIKKYFKGNSPLRQELGLYDVLINQKVADSNFALKIVETVLNSKDSIDKPQLIRDKYNLLREISQKYDVDSFFKTKVGNYPVYASIYNLLEYTEKDSLEEYLKHKVNVVNHLLTAEPATIKSTKSLTEDIDPELKNLTFKLMAEKFNEKWASLNENQKEVLRQFITNAIDSKESFEFMKEQVSKIEKSLREKLSVLNDEVLRIKLTEVLNVLPKIENSSFITENHYLSLIRYYELLEEINK